MVATKEQRLMQRVKDNRARRAQALAQTQWFADRKRAIDDSPVRHNIDMWCDACNRDFTCMDAVKIRTAQQGIPGAYYEGMCPERHKSVRYITDKHMDPYYQKSHMVRQQQWAHRDDLLTPADPRFRVIYPKQWAQLEAEREQRALAEELENKQVYG